MKSIIFLITTLLNLSFTNPKNSTIVLFAIPLVIDESNSSVETVKIELFRLLQKMRVLAILKVSPNKSQEPYLRLPKMIFPIK